MEPYRDTTYLEAARKVMLQNGYFAPLKLLYREIWKYKNREKIHGITPNNTIQALVQRDPEFTKIGLGVYALTQYLDKLPKEFTPKTAVEQKERAHARIQGMLLEIGNSRDDVDETYTNDKKWIFQNKTLGSLATLQSIPPFTYEHIIKNSVSFADVIWFNSRGFPSSIFEVEQSTDFRDAFVKFTELQDFTTKFYCVSSEDRASKFDKEIAKVAFQPISSRVTFLTYPQVENDYQNILSKNFI